MERKKEKEESEIYHAPFGSITIPPYPEIDLSPYTIETTGLCDSQRRFITVPPPEVSITYTGSIGDVSIRCGPSVEYWDPSSTILGREALTRKLEKEEEGEMKLEVEKLKDSDMRNVCRVYCRDNTDLSQGKILLTLSAIKGRLMMEVIDKPIIEFHCGMTSIVKNNLIQAGRRAKMYGRKMPIIASFDEFWNPLPDQIEIMSSRGVSIDILDPELHR